MLKFSNESCGYERVTYYMPRRHLPMVFHVVEILLSGQLHVFNILQSLIKHFTIIVAVWVNYHVTLLFPSDNVRKDPMMKFTMFVLIESLRVNCLR